MRGSNIKTQEEIPSPTITTRKVTTVAVVIDANGNVAYVVKSTWTSTLIVVALMIMMAICVSLTLVVYLNYVKINSIEKEITKPVEQKAN